jgi:hypothetical protein
MLDDPTAPPIYRTSGEPPYHGPLSPLPDDVVPTQVTLRDRVTKATLVPFSSPDQVPMSLTSYLCDQLNKEIEKGDTYPMIDAMPLEKFGPYWFANFGAVMLLGDIQDASELHQMEQNPLSGTSPEPEAGTPPAPPRNWEKECLGSFYIKPNYPGRSSHVCNGGFLVTDGARNRGVGRLMGECYLQWAPKLVSLTGRKLDDYSDQFQGYTYSIFNLVYETNVASCRIWDALGFKRVGRVKGCGNLKSYPNQLIDAIIFGRDLGPDGEDYVSEERFEKIRFYLKHSKYPNGADRAEKSRLRSAATHYKLVPSHGTEPEKLMLKGKEVVSDPQKQYDVARRMHMEHHGGINKTTATIAEKYHWVRIKETVSQVIKNCAVCKEAARGAATRPKYASTMQSTVIPFNREFSVPPGENWLRLYGSATTPGASYDDETPIPVPTHHTDVDGDGDLEPQHQEPDTNMEYSAEGSVPVDPMLMEGIENSHNENYIESQHDGQFEYSVQEEVEVEDEELTTTHETNPTRAKYRRATRRTKAAIPEDDIARQLNEGFGP